MSDQPEGKLRSLGEVKDHALYWTTGPSLAVWTVANFGNPITFPFPVQINRVFLTAGSTVSVGPVNTAQPVAGVFNFVRTPVTGAATNLLYTEGAANAFTTTTVVAPAVTSTTQTTLTVASSTGFPAGGGIPTGQIAQGTTVVAPSGGYVGPPGVQYLIEIDNEIMLVTGGQGTTTWTVTRAVGGTTAATHSAAATVNYLNRPFLLTGLATGSFSSVLTTGVSPALTPIMFNGPENPLLNAGDTLQPFCKRVGDSAAGGGTAANASLVTFVIHYERT